MMNICQKLLCRSTAKHFIPTLSLSHVEGILHFVLPRIETENVSLVHYQKTCDQKTDAFRCFKYFRHAFCCLKMSFSRNHLYTAGKLNYTNKVAQVNKIVIIECGLFIKCNMCAAVKYISV